MMKNFFIDFPDSSELPVSDQAKQEIELKLKEEILIYQVKEELYCKGRYRIFFDHYDEESIHAFIDAYARRKAFYLLNGPQILNDEEAGQLYFRNLADHFIWEIQQKKLFNLQCLWRAGQLKIDKVEVTKDFLLLESKIKNCGLVKHITEAEMKLYIDYILSDDYADTDHVTTWQDYEYIKAGNRLLFPAVPAWYGFYDKAMETGNLLTLPDSKGEKENYYLNLLENENNDISESEKEKQPVLELNYKSLEFFINTFEDKQIAKYFNAAEKNHHDLNQNGELDEALYLLQLSDENIAVQQNSNWKEAVINAANNFKKKKITEVLMQVFDEYKMRLKTGIPFYNENDLLRQQLIKVQVDKYKQKILKARQLNGETADFNF